MKTWALALVVGGMMMTTQAKAETATFGAGCFWCVEYEFQKEPGVSEVISGWMGGDEQNPTYKQVTYEDTGHAEVAHITYDPKVTSYQKLLQTFWAVHDPTQLNRQGPDVGPQYRSVIFYHTPEQKAQAEASIAAEQAKPQYKDRKIVTEISPAKPFWPAEEYHQDYYEKNPVRRMIYENFKARR